MGRAHLGLSDAETAFRARLHTGTGPGDVWRQLALLLAREWRSEETLRATGGVWKRTGGGVAYTGYGTWC